MNGECIEIEIVSPNSHKILPNGAGCAQCNDGYYRNSTKCEKCPEGCITCLTESLCFSCEEEYYMTPFMSLCEPYSNLGDICLNKTQNGCEQCIDGYYLDKGHCVECNEGCKTCDNGIKCTACLDDYVRDIHLSQFVCRNLTEVEFCVKARDSNCIECSEGYIPSDDKTKCMPPSKIGMILGIIFGSLGLVFIITIGLVLLIIYLIEKRR